MRGVGCEVEGVGIGGLSEEGVRARNNWVRGYVGSGFEGGGGGWETGRKGVTEMRGMVEMRAVKVTEEKLMMIEVQWR